VFEVPTTHCFTEYAHVSVAVGLTALNSQRAAIWPHEADHQQADGAINPVTVYLPPEDIAALDRLADLRTVRTGKNTSRSDLVREAVKRLLQAELR